MGPSGHFYLCIGLIIGDTSIPQVDGLSTRHPGIGASHFYIFTKYIFLLISKYFC